MAPSELVDLPGTAQRWGRDGHTADLAAAWLLRWPAAGAVGGCGAGSAAAQDRPIELPPAPGARLKTHPRRYRRPDPLLWLHRGNPQLRH